MLTNIFYYNYYKPYIIKNSGSEVSPVQKKAKVYDKTQTEVAQNKSVYLNKALKVDVVSYANNVSQNVVGLKDTAKNFLRDVANFDKNSYQRGYVTAKSWLAEDLGEFVDKYNEATDFLSSQNHSQPLKDYAQIVTETVGDSMNQLAALGVETSSESSNKLVFNKEAFDKILPNNLSKVTNENSFVFDNLYYESSALLTMPLSEHMNFKGLNYYYSYKMGTVVSDSFKLIEQGILFDKVV